MSNMSFAVLIYRHARNTGELLIDRCVGGFADDEAALRWADEHEFVPGQDFSVVEVEHVDADKA
jgi:hypothetical protein